MSGKVEEALLKGLRAQGAAPRNHSPRQQTPAAAKEGSHLCPLPTELSVA
jgi:hypothetical protein